MARAGRARGRPHQRFPKRTVHGNPSTKFAPALSQGIEGCTAAPGSEGQTLRNGFSSGKGHRSVHSSPLCFDIRSISVHERPGPFPLSRRLLLTALVFALVNVSVAVRVSAAMDAPATGMVVKVFDGDTVLLNSGEKVRYLGIDAPEVAHEDSPADCYGAEAKTLNEELVLHRRVQLRYERVRTDSHGRLLAYVYLPDGRCVNDELVLNGCAVVFHSSEGFSRFHEVLAHQKAALRHQRGLWGRCPVDPSDHYLANRKSYVFHRPDCPFGRQTGSKNRLRFDSRESALESGFSPCRRCRP